MKNCQIIISPVYKITNRWGTCKGCGKFEGEKASLLACLPCEMMLFGYCCKTNCSSQLMVESVLRRGNLEYTSSSSAVS